MIRFFRRPGTPAPPDAEKPPPRPVPLDRSDGVFPFLDRLLDRGSPPPGGWWKQAFTLVVLAGCVAGVLLAAGYGLLLLASADVSPLLMVGGSAVGGVSGAFATWRILLASAARRARSHEPSPTDSKSSSDPAA